VPKAIRSLLIRFAQPMTALGHEGQFPAPEPSARYRFGQETFAGTRGNERDAPEAVVPAPRLAAALVTRLQTEPQLRPRYFCLGPITRTAGLFRFVETARPNISRVRSCARPPDEDLALIADLFS
jgi:hypothetical protein